MRGTMNNIVVCFSGRGSHLKNLIDHQYSFKISGCITNNSEAPGILHALEANIPVAIISKESDLLKAVSSFNPGLVVLAGYMAILKGEIIDRYRIINVHPSLLPKYRGLRTHQRAIENGDSIHGATVHYVTERLDDGPIISQVSIPIYPDDTAESLASRLLPLEHELLLNTVEDMRLPT